MIFIWSVKYEPRKAGWTVDWCPMCRDVKLVAVTEIRRKLSIYWIPMGFGRRLRYERDCMGCELPLRHCKKNRRPVTVDEPIADAMKYLKTSDPIQASKMVARREREAAIDAGTHAIKDRVAIMVEALCEISDFRKFGGSREISPLSALIWGVLFVLAVILLIASTPHQSVWAQRPIPTGAFILAGLTLLALIFTVRRAWTSEARRVRAAVTNPVSFIFKRLDPSTDEIETALAFAEEEGSHIARHLRSNEIGRAVSNLSENLIVIGR